MQQSFKRIEHIIDRPDLYSDKGVILIAGSSANALTDKRYNALSEMLRQDGFYFLRFELWQTEEELNGFTLEEIHEVIDEAVTALKSSGCNKIGMVGKGFGGAIMLAYYNPEIKSRVAWSPAIEFSGKSNISKVKSKKLSKIPHFTDMKINKDDLSKIKCPVLIIQGTKDEIVKKENSEKIYEALPNGSISFMAGFGHSFNKPNEMKVVVRKTADFLAKTIK